MPKNILDKEVNQINLLRTAGYLDPKDQDKIKDKHLKKCWTKS